MLYIPDYFLCIYYIIIMQIRVCALSYYSNDVACLVDQFCKFWLSSLSMWTFLLASSYNLTAMSIERHGAITQPVRHDEHKVRRRFPLILILVYMAVILHLLPIYLSAQHVDGVCMVMFSLSESFRYALIYIYMLMNLIIPGFVMLFCYIRMALFLKPGSPGSDVMKSGYLG